MRMATLLGLISMSLLAGCTGTASAPSGGDASSEEGGKVVVEGSSTVLRISQAAQLGFKKARPDVRILVSGKGTGTGFGRYLEGEVDIIDASRKAKPEEQQQAEAKGFGWTRYIVGYDGITVVVNPENTFCKVLTVEQLRRLFEPDSQVQTWKDLDPAWPARKISLFAPDNDSGTFEFFAEAVLGQDKDSFGQRKDIQVSPDDNTLVTGVAGDPGGIGYFGYAYYAANQSRLRAVPIQDGPDASPVLPSRETILDGSYHPLARPLFIYAKNASLARPEVAAFVRYYIENIDTLATQARYVPPTESDQADNLKALPPSSGASEAG